MNAFNDHVISEKFIELCENVATIKDDMIEMKQLKQTVEQHDRIVQYGKWTALPILAGIHIGLKHILNKLGWS